MIREIRERRGLTQEQLAKRMRVPPSMISHFEIGSRKPSYHNLNLLADALQVTADEVMGRTQTCTFDGDFISILSELTTDDLDLVDRFARMLLDRKAN